MNNLDTDMTRDEALLLATFFGGILIGVVGGVLLAFVFVQF
ncbi:MAG: hypothetical protein O2854_09125 [Chloroflexi bacterium]|nr:hypothetical protein [Chloroflexota bacterium]